MPADRSFPRSSRKAISNVYHRSRLPEKGTKNVAGTKLDEGFGTSRSLEERIAAINARPAPPPKLLAQRISDPLPVVSRPTVKLINFSKKSPNELMGIFNCKLDATFKRVIVLFKDQYIHTLDPDRKNRLNHLGNKFEWLQNNLANEAARIKPAEFQSLDWGFKKIGEVSFHSVRSRYSTIVDNILEVYNGGYFDWIQA